MHAFSSFQVTLYSKRYLGPLQMISYTLEIGLSIIQLPVNFFIISQCVRSGYDPTCIILHMHYDLCANMNYYCNVWHLHLISLLQ